MNIHQGFKAVINVSYLKADGSIGQVKGVPEWTISNPDAGILIPADDGLSAEVTWNGEANNVEVKSIANGELGDGLFEVVVSTILDFTPPLGAVSGLAVVEEIPI